MNQNKYSATWVSHSSISDFLNCHRAYYLKNVYKDPKTNHKINIINPSLALGQAVHDVLESMSSVKAENRFKESLLSKYENIWQKVSGKSGGFKDINQEQEYKDRGKKMIQRVIDNPGPLLNKAIKIKQDLPYYYLSKEENIILCGKVDWLEYISKDDTVHVIDFKTGKQDKDLKSLQLLIYYLLIENCQKRKVSKVSYWYLDTNNAPTELELVNLNKAHNKIFEIARKIKLLRKTRMYNCKHKGCFHCLPFESIVNNKAEYVGIGNYNQDIYIINK